MPRQGITKDDVAAAALQLNQAGHPVTTVNVRRELARGSLTTISRHLEALGAKQRGRRPLPADVMPPALRAVCDGFVQRTWETLRDHARAQEEQVASPLRLRIRDLASRLTQARELRERLAWEATQLRRDLQTTQEEVRELNAQLVRAHAELAVEQRLRNEHDAGPKRIRRPESGSRRSGAGDASRSTE